MKKTLLITTCITTVLLSTSIFASSVTKMIEVALAPNTIYVDNSKIETPSFLYNGTTYAPLRSITESMGADVNFDSANKIIKISSNESTSSSNMDSFTPNQLRAVSLVKEWTGYFDLSRNEVLKSLKNMSEESEYYFNFTNAEAIFAVDNSGVNWQEEATGQVKFYKEADISKLEIISRLVDEGFTQSEIEIALKENGL